MSKTLKGIAEMLSLYITRKEISIKNLDQIKQESKEIKDKIDDTEERLRQLKNQEKKILKQDIVKRNHLLNEQKIDLDKLGDRN